MFDLFQELLSRTKKGPHTLDAGMLRMLAQAGIRVEISDDFEHHGQYIRANGSTPHFIPNEYLIGDYMEYLDKITQVIVDCVNESRAQPLTVNAYFNQLGGNLRDQPKNIPSREQRVAEINDELDIIRGVKPTPKGYRVDVRRTKQLMAELKELQNA